MMFCKCDFQYFKWIKKKYQIITHTLTGIFKSDNRFILKCQNVQYVEKYIFATILNLWWIFMSALKYVRGSIILELFLEFDGSSVYSVRSRSTQSIKSSARCIFKRIAERQRDHPSWSTVGQKRKKGESLVYRYSLWFLTILILVPRPYHTVPQACSWDVLKLTKPGANLPIPPLELCCGVTCHTHVVILGVKASKSPVHTTASSYCWC